MRIARSLLLKWSAEAAGEHFKRIAGGDLTREVVSPGRNEIGELFLELQRMQASLNRPGFRRYLFALN